MRRIGIIALFLIILIIYLGQACAGLETLTVPAYGQVDRTITLSKGDFVQGNITVYGGSGNDTNFYVTDVHANVLMLYNHTSKLDFSFSAQETGTYTLHFDNSFSPDEKSVTLDYTVSSVMNLYPAIIVGIVIIAIIIATAIIALMRKSTESTSK